MKKLLILSAIIAVSLSANPAKAQVGIRFNINFGRRPVYVPAPQQAPVVDDDYYYLPDAQAYYSVPQHVYYYQNEGRWISGAHLPGRFYNDDYSRMRHFAINEPQPYLRNDYYHAQYNSQRDDSYQNYGHHDNRNQNYNETQNRGNYQAYNNRSENHEQHQNERNYGGGRNGRY